MDQQDIFVADLKALEDKLKERLQPIEPNQEFISELGKDLAKACYNGPQRRLGEGLLLTAGGFMIGLLIFWIGRKFLEAEGD